MKSASDNIPAIYMYAESWIAGTRDLHPLQRGIYWDLIVFAQTYGAKGLPYDIVKLQRLVLLCNPDDLEDWERQKKDLYYVLQKKWEVRKNWDADVFQIFGQYRTQGVWTSEPDWIPFTWFDTTVAQLCTSQIPESVVWENILIIDAISIVAV